MKHSYWRIRETSDYVCIVIARFPNDEVQLSLLAVINRYGNRITGQIIALNQFPWYRQFELFVKEINKAGKKIKNDTQFMLALDVIFAGKRPKKYQKLRRYEEWEMESLKQ